MDRRTFLCALAASAALPGCQVRQPALPPGGFVGPQFERGHRLRGGDFPAVSETRHVDVAIIGGGVGGLSAAWKLQREGFHEFRLFELEDEVGGNARSGKNAVSAYPWGAHYLPLPGPAALAVRELLSDLRVMLDAPDTLAPRYEERYLCFAPQERLYRHGRWQEGLLPRQGIHARDSAQYEAFQQTIEKLKRMRGRDGRRVFEIPMALSSRDAEFRSLDRISMRQYLLQQGWDSAPLHWYVNYACRDDYGSDYSIVSAWAGLHYFAGREGRGQDAESDQVLTWPEGNAWLTERMRARYADRIETGALVHRIAQQRHGVEIDVLQVREQHSVRWIAKQVIFAAPAFVLAHVMQETGSAQLARDFSYAPWLVANLSLKALPAERSGTGLSWDNVMYDSSALGYVVATHQHLRVQQGPTVLTYYWALSDRSPAQARQQLLQTPWQDWAQLILRDLERPHPDIRQQVQQLDIFRWAHAMAQPRVGFLESQARLRLEKPIDRVHFAHADASGFSIFEEANYRGVLAAERVLKQLGVKFTSSL